MQLRQVQPTEVEATPSNASLKTWCVRFQIYILIYSLDICPDNRIEATPSNASLKILNKLLQWLYILRGDPIATVVGRTIVITLSSPTYQHLIFARTSSVQRASCGDSREFILTRAFLRQLEHSWDNTCQFLRQHTCANQQFKSLLLCHCESTSILFLMAALQNQLTFNFFDLELLSPSAFVASYGQDVWGPLHWNRLSGNHELFPLNLSKEIN